MWYNSVTKEILCDIDIYDILSEIAHENEHYFNADEILDDCYPSVNYCGTTFYPSEIVKNLAPDVYSAIIDDEIDRWIQDSLYNIHRCELKDGDTLTQCIDYFKNDAQLSIIVWRSEDE